MCFLHLYMGYTQPLFIQAIMTLKGVLECVLPPNVVGLLADRKYDVQVQTRHVAPLG